MSASMLSSNSDETEGSREENVAQEARGMSPRSELLSETPPQRGKIPATEGHHVSRRRHTSTKRHRSDREPAHAGTSPEDLLKLLIDQEHETRRLRRALLTAADRIDIESRRAADVERVNSDVADRFKIVNDSRLAAEREALKASQELRLHQFQLQTAQTEITRAQEALRVVQTQRDEAEVAAAQAREKARRLQQDRMVSAAREEGRKFGFEAGFKRAHEEYGFVVRQPTRRRNQNPSRRTERNERVPPPVEDTHVVQQRNEVVRDDDGLLSPISSPLRLPLRGLAQANSPEDTRFETPPPASNLQVQQPSQDVHPPSLPSAAPAPVAQQIPAHPLRHSSSSIPLQIYQLDIPPTHEIEQQYGRNEPTRKATRPWVTANEHLEMSHRQQQQMMQEQFEGIFQPSGADLSRNMSQPAAGPSAKRKDTWYNRLRRKTFGRKNKQEVPTTRPSVDDPHSSQSWYKRRPLVHVRDFAIPPKPRSSVDSGSASTRVSQLEIVSTPNESISGRSGRLGAGFARKFKQNLQAISEDPMSRETTPHGDDFGHRLSRSADTPEASGSTYSDPKAVEEWRKSSASTPRMPSNASPRRPPTYLRRPAQLTVPERLAPDDGMLESSRERTIWDNTGTFSPSRPPPSTRSSLRVVNADEPEISPGIGITVQPPSRSPTEAVKTPTLSQIGNGYLSPNHAHQSLPPQVIDLAPSFSSVGHPPADASTARDPMNHSHSQSRPPSHGYAPSVRSVRSATQNQGDSHANSPRGSTRNQLPPSSNGWYPSPGRMSLPLPADQPVPSRAQSHAGAATPRMSSVDLRLTPGSVRNQPLPPTNGNDNLGLSHVPSNTSLRSSGSLYTKFNSKAYLDPAYFPPEDSAVVNGNISDTAQARRVSSLAPRSRAHSRVASTSSSPGLEYINPP